MKKKILAILFLVLFAIPDMTMAQATDGGGKDFFGHYTNDLPVYPNPTMGIVRIVLDKSPICPVEVYVIDMNGYVTGKYEYAAGTYNIDVDMSTLPTGIYSVRISGKDVSAHNLKVVKQ